MSTSSKCIGFFYLLFIAKASNSQSVGTGTTTPVDKLTVQTPLHSYGITHTDGNIKVSSFIGGGLGVDGSAHWKRD